MGEFVIFVTFVTRHRRLHERYAEKSGPSFRLVAFKPALIEALA
jgi:hypothetical protein